MKKYLQLLLILTISNFAGCSNDDDDNSQNNDPIIGEWGNYQDTYINDNGMELIDESYDPYYSIDTFNSDGTVVSESSLFGTITGTWENVGGGNYKMSALGFTVTNIVDFFCENNIMKWEDDEYGYFYYERLNYDNELCDDPKIMLVNANNNILGTWYFESSQLDGVNVTSQSIVSFTSDNRVGFTYYNYGDNFTDYGDWFLEGDTLIITWDDADVGNEMITLNISELTDSSLTWEELIDGEGTLRQTMNKCCPELAYLSGVWNTQSSKLDGVGVSSQSKVSLINDYTTRFTYIDNGSQIIEKGTWVFNDNTLTITWDDADPGLETYVLQINEITTASLKWQTDISGEGTLVETFTR